MAPKYPHVEVPSEWFVAFTNPRRETTTADAVRRRAFSTYVPVMTVTHRRSAVKQALFPRYIFVGLAQGQNLLGLRQTPGLEGMVRVAGCPVAVKTAMLDAIRAAEAAGTYNFTDARKAEKDASAKAERWGTGARGPADPSRAGAGRDRDGVAELMAQSPEDGAGFEPSPGRPRRPPRILDRDWRQRHIDGQADGTMPPGRIQLRHVDGTLVFDRLGRPRYWSAHVAQASVRGRFPKRETDARAARAEAAARVAAAAKELRAKVMPGYRPPAGKLFGVDLVGLLVIGPAGAIGTSALVARTLAILAAGGRHPVEALVAAGWRDEAHLRGGLDRIEPKLAVIGLRLDWGKAGVRVGKAKGLPSLTVT